MLYDISQPLLECEVYPGDPKPEITELSRMSAGDPYNLTAISLCTHNGTHVDAPRHFIEDGKGVDQIDLGRFVGPAFVATCSGKLGERDAREILEQARVSHEEAWRKVLIKGNADVTLEAAKVFADAGVELVGTELMTVGSDDELEAVHQLLLGHETVLLEGLRLAHVPDGAYLLNCAPLNLTGADGAPCRAILMDL